VISLDTVIISLWLPYLLEKYQARIVHNRGAIRILRLVLSQVAVDGSYSRCYNYVFPAYQRSCHLLANCNVQHVIETS